MTNDLKPQMPEEICVYPPTGDVPIRVWYEEKDVAPHWNRQFIKYKRADLVPRPEPVQEITPANKAAIERYIHGCGAPPTVSDVVVIEPINLEDAVTREDAEMVETWLKTQRGSVVGESIKRIIAKQKTQPLTCSTCNRSYDSSRHMSCPECCIDNLTAENKRLKAQQLRQECHPVTDDALQEAVKHAEQAIKYIEWRDPINADCCTSLINNKHLKTLVIHALNAEHRGKLLDCYGGTEKCGEALAKERYDAYTQGFEDALKGGSK